MVIAENRSRPRIDWRVFVLVGVGFVAALTLWLGSCLAGPSMR